MNRDQLNRSPFRSCIVAIFCAGMWACTQLSYGQEPAELTWVTGDTHLHTHGCAGTVAREDLAQRMQDAGLQVGSVLVFGRKYDEVLPLFTGQDDPASKPGLIVHYDLEVSAFAASQLGHIVALGLSEVEFSSRPFSSPGSGVPIVEWARDQGPRSLVGMAHAWAFPAREWSFSVAGLAPSEFPIHVANGTMSFLEEGHRGSATLPISPGTMRLWRAIQNSGFRIPLTGGSDFKCNDSIGNDLSSPIALRTLVLVEGELSYESYLDGIRAGRTAVSVGAADRMDMSIEGVRLGDEFQTSAGVPLRVAIETDLSSRDSVSVLVNGEPVQTLMVDAGPQSSVLTLTLDQSSWVTARSSRVQTSAIYGLVDGEPIRASADDACYLVQYVDRLADRVSQGDFNRVDVAAVLPAYEHARDVYEQRFFEAGGTTCGLQPGDANQDFSFDELDLIQVEQSGKYLAGRGITWAEGDWNAAPGGTPGFPPRGNRRFNQLDIIAALSTGLYLTGPYGNVTPPPEPGDGQASILYDADTGELAIRSAAGVELSSVNIDSASGIFTRNSAANLGGTFDNDTDDNIFKATFGGSFGSLSFGSVATAGLTERFIRGDLTVIGSLASGGKLGAVNVIYVPVPSTLMLAAIGMLSVFAVCDRRRPRNVRKWLRS